MFPALLFLVSLIIATPIIIWFDGPITHGLVSAVMAASVAIVALRIRPGEVSFLSSIIRPVAVVAAVPVLWMLIQVLPLTAVGLAHPIWDSAATALEQPLAGSISIDRGATLVSLSQYLSTVAVALVAAAIALDRRRAEWILFAVVAATAATALMAVVASIGGFTFLNDRDGALAHHAAIDIAGLGVVVASAAAFHIVENGRAQRGSQHRLDIRSRLSFGACLVALAICVLAVAMDAAGLTWFAVVCGITTLLAAIANRRFALGPWGNSAIAAVALVVAIAVIASQPGNRTTDLTLAFAADAPSPLTTLTHRVLTETSWTGTGAGTFAAVLPFYRATSEMAVGQIAPTAAAKIAVEMGWPFLAGAILAALALIVMFLRGSVRRGRDSLYSAAGAGCVVTIALLAFGNAAIFSTSVLIVTTAVIGIAIAQTNSRST